MTSGQRLEPHGHTSRMLGPPGPSPRASEGAWPCDALILDCQPSELEENKLPLFSAPAAGALLQQSQERHPAPFVKRSDAALLLCGPGG